METSPLPVKAANLTYTRLHVTRDNSLSGHLRGPVTTTPVAGDLAMELSLPVLTT